eukprot:5634699-Prymnesium_polylepis.1
MSWARRLVRDIIPQGVYVGAVKSVNKLKRLNSPKRRRKARVGVRSASGYAVFARGEVQVGQRADSGSGSRPPRRR